jgi:hypothetical protein
VILTVAMRPPIEICSSYEDTSFDLLASSAGRKKQIPRFARNDNAARAAR